jgi:diguanylate cyclase (GGDEF)-like protein/PAS domain S-box-containing protein
MIRKARVLTRVRNWLFWASLAGTILMLFGLARYVDSGVRAARDASNARRAEAIVADLKAAVARDPSNYAIADVVARYAAQTDVDVTVVGRGGLYFVVAATRAGPAGGTLHQFDAALTPLVDEVTSTGRPDAHVGDLHENVLRLIAPIGHGTNEPGDYVAIVRVDGSLAASEAMKGRMLRVSTIFGLWLALIAILNGFLQLSIDRAMHQVVDEIKSAGDEARAAQTAAESALTELRDYKSGLDHHALVAVFNLDGEITHVNDVYCRVSKYSREDLIGRTFSKLLAERQPAGVWNALRSHLERGEVWNGEIVSRAKDGSPYFVETTVVPLHDAQDERVQRVVVLGTDVTQRRLDQEALRVARDAAEEATQAKSAFLANMSHEIRTPMTAILGYADLLYAMEDGRNEERTEYLTTIRRNGEHLLAVINDILDLTKIEVGRLEMLLEDTDLVQVVEEVVSLMRVRALDRNLDMHVEYGATLPRHVRTDGTRLKQVLLNLLGNAIKFTETGAVTLKIGYDWGDAPSHGQVRFDVIDTGIGMNEQQLQNLFRPFQQADASTTRRFGGTGLGLHISQRLVSLLGGQLTVTSQPDVGSHFVATIAAPPIGRDVIEVGASGAAVTGRLLAMSRNADERRRHDDAEVPIHVNEHTLRGVRVLLVEDGPDNQRLIALHLRKAGGAVTVAENGRVALEMLTTTATIDGALAEPASFDLIVTDMQMPEMDGYELARVLRRRGWARPIIALTAHAMTGDAERCYAAGCDAYATKPIDRDALISLCARHARFDASGGGARDPLATTMIVERPRFDDPEMQALAEEFAIVLPERIDEIVEALAASDREGLKRCAHRLKGAAGGYGYPTISAAARDLEEAVSNGLTLTTPVRRLTALCEAAARQAREGGDDAFGDARASDPLDADGLSTTARRRVLLVDDSPDLATLVSWHLRSLDVDVQHALDGRRAVAMAQQSSPDLVLLDFDLPVMNGLVVMEKLRALPQTAHVPIIFLTGSDNQELQMTAFEQGANDFIRKPFQPAELKARVRAALHTQALVAELERQATHDRLTGLPNRALLYAKLNDAIEEHRANPHLHFALLFLDFDGFKKLNDTYGHEAGDKLLLEFAARLRKATRQTDPASRGLRMLGTPARLGGDEFVVLLTRLRRPEDAEAVVARIQSQLKPPYSIQGHLIESSASIGVALGSKAYRAADEVVRDADVAMYVAKSRGGGCRVVFNPAMTAEDAVAESDRAASDPA